METYIHPHTQRESKTFSMGGEGQAKNVSRLFGKQPHPLGGKEYACMLKRSCVLAG